MEAEDVLGEAKAGRPSDGLDRLRPVGPEDLRIGLRGEGAELMREGPPRMTAADEAVRALTCPLIFYAAKSKRYAKPAGPMTT
jgi:hypothetical protein